MASTVPAKSQTLYGFSLPQWNLTKNHSNNHHRGRRGADSSSSSQQLPPHDTARQGSPSRRYSPNNHHRGRRDIDFSSSRQLQPHDTELHRSPARRHSLNDHNRGRRGADSSSSSQQLPPRDTATRRSPSKRHSPLIYSANRQSTVRDFESESSQAVTEKRKNSLPSQPHTGKNSSIVSSSSDHATVKSEKQPESSDHDKDEGKDSQSKIYIRLKNPSKNNKPFEGQAERNQDTEGVQVEESMAKTWNLRPRKPTRKQTNTNVGNNPSVMKSSPENKVQQPQTISKRSSEMRSGAQATVPIHKEKKQKLSIPLSRDKIEEDMCAMMGSKPNRRPKKRSKMVQRQLDSLFPGLWLSTITPDAYEVSEIQ